MKVPKLRFKEFDGEWEEKLMGEVGSFKKGSNLSKADLSVEGKPCILYGELYTTYGPVIRKAVSKTDKDLKSPVCGMRNDVLVPASGETAEDIATASCLQIDDILLGGDINIFTPEKDDGSFISYQLNSSRKKQIVRWSQGASVVHIYKDALSKLKLRLPSMKEQQKISNMFAALDLRIESQHQKVESLKEQKKGLLQKIFSRKLRFKNENGEEFPEWKTKRIEDLFTERNEKKQPCLPLLAVTLSGGVTLRDELSRSDTSSDNKDNYKVVKPNDIPYNTMRMWQGASGVSDYEGIISPAYTVLKPKNEVDSKFFAYKFKTKRLLHDFSRFSQGLTSDTWNLKYPLIAKIEVKTPVYQEQVKISSFITAYDKWIAIEEAKLSLFQEQKKGLMQQMFI